MLDIFLGVIERLIQLVEARKKLNRQMFVDHVEPIYKELQIIIDDYRQILLDAKEKIEKEGINPSEELREKRKKYERIRSGVRQYSDALASQYAKPESEKNDPFATFVLNCRDLFAFGPTTSENDETGFRIFESSFFSNPNRSVFSNPNHSVISVLTANLDSRLVNDLSKNYSNSALIAIVDKYSGELEQRWDKVASSYFNLRVKYLK